MTCGYVTWDPNRTLEQVIADKGYRLCGAPATTRCLLEGAPALFELCDEHAAKVPRLPGEFRIPLDGNT